MSILNEHQFPMTLYRGEGSHDTPSYYPTKGPDAWRAGAWYTSDANKASNYARSAKGQVYRLEVTHGEAEPSGMTGNYLVRDPAVRARRTPLEENRGQ